MISNTMMNRMYFLGRKCEGNDDITLWTTFLKNIYDLI